MWYLCVFFHRLLDYRRPEVEALAELFGAFGEGNGDGKSSLQWRLPEQHHPDSPFHFVDLPSEDVARSIANRSILVKGIYELWGEGSSYEELEEAIKGYPDERKLPYLISESTFKITVDSFGKVISFQEQNERIQGLAYIPFKIYLGDTRDILEEIKQEVSRGIVEKSVGALSSYALLWRADGWTVTKGIEERLSH